MIERYFKLDGPIVRDSVTALMFTEGSPVVVGGLAIQIHAREMRSFWRNTPDLDLILPGNIEYENFVSTVAPGPTKFLKREGYQVQTKRGRNNNTLKVMRNQNKPDAEEFLVHFTHFSPRVWENFQDYVERQIEFSKQMYFSSSQDQVQTVALEEIIPLKLQRSIRYGTNRLDLVGPVYPTLIEHAKRGNWGHLAGMPIKDWRLTINKLQEESGKANPLKLEREQTYKLSKDIYDLCLAARVISDSISTFDKDRYEDNIRRILEREQTSPQNS